MSSIPRKYGLKNDKFATRITSKDRSANATPRRTTSFYVLGFLLVVLVLSGFTEMIMHIKQARRMR